MPDENNQAVESSAPATAVLEAPSNPDSPEYANWRLNGKIPEPSKAAPEKPAPVSETGVKQQERRPSKAEARLNEILDDLRFANLTPAQLKALRREGRQAAEAIKPPEQPVKPAEPEGPPKRPQYVDFAHITDQNKAWEAYQKAEDEYHDKLTDYKVQKALREDRIRQAQENGQREMRERLNKAKERYGDGAESRIIQTAKDIFNDGDVAPAVKAILNDSDVLVDVMYVMGSNAEDMAQFLEEAKTAPGKAIRRAVLLERLVKEELAKSTKAAPREALEESEEDDEEPPPAKKVTKAGPPPREASGRAAAPPDEIASAVSANDARRYFTEQNRRDLQRRRSG